MLVLGLNGPSYDYMNICSLAQFQTGITATPQKGCYQCQTVRLEVISHEVSKSLSVELKTKTNLSKRHSSKLEALINYCFFLFFSSC